MNGFVGEQSFTNHMGRLGGCGGVAGALATLRPAMGLSSPLSFGGWPPSSGESYKMGRVPCSWMKASFFLVVALLLVGSSALAVAASPGPSGPPDCETYDLPFGAFIERCDGYDFTIGLPCGI
jgi:hypothetical protein